MGCTLNMDRWTVFLLLLVVGHFPGVGWATPRQLVEFSAEVTRSDATHPELPSSGMMYVGHDGIRTESHQNNQPVWMIFKPDSKRVWTVFPKQQAYMERAGLSLEWPPLPEDENSPCRNKKFRCKKMGNANFDNRSTVHWSVDFVDEKGESPYAQLWVDPRLNIAIRETYADGLTVEMHHIREGSQPAHLFELPSGYQKVVLPAPPPPSGGATK